MALGYSRRKRRRYKGGGGSRRGGGGASQVQSQINKTLQKQLKDLQEREKDYIKPPKISDLPKPLEPLSTEAPVIDNVPVAPAPPDPATMYADYTQDASRQSVGSRANRRKGLRSTRKAKETGGYLGGSSDTLG